MVPSEDEKIEDKNLVEETADEGEPDTAPEAEIDENDIEDEELGSEETFDAEEQKTETGDPGIPVAEETLPNVNWNEKGPKLWRLLKKLLGGNKTKYDDKYVIEASHETVGEAHDELNQ